MLLLGQYDVSFFKKYVILKKYITYPTTSKTSERKSVLEKEVKGMWKTSEDYPNENN